MRIKIWCEIAILKYNFIADVTYNLFKNREIAYKEKYLRNKKFINNTLVGLIGNAHLFFLHSTRPFSNFPTNS